jgi:hypothetical protein
VGIRCQQIALVAASVILAIVAEASHVHGPPGTHASHDVFTASSQSISIAEACAFCTLVHIAPTAAVDCLGRTPRAEQSLNPSDAQTLPAPPAIYCNASRAPPSLLILGT